MSSRRSSGQGKHENTPEVDAPERTILVPEGPHPG